MRRSFLVLAVAVLVTGGWAGDAQGVDFELLVPNARSPGRLAEGPDGQVAGGHHRRDQSGSEIFVTHPGGSGLLTLLPGIRITDSAGSPGGMLFSGDENGFIPNRYFLIDAAGSVVQRPTYPATAGQLGGFFVGHGGEVGFVGRHSSTTRLNVAYLDRPLIDPHAQEFDTTSILTPPQGLTASSLVDSQGRLMIARDTGPSTVYRRESDVWVPLFTTSTGAAHLLDIAPDDRFIVAAGTTSPLIYRSDQLGTPLFGAGGNLAYGAIADNGAVTVAAGTRVHYYSAAGDLLELGELVGPDNTPTGTASMNAQGEVAMLTSGVDRKLWYFDGNELHLIASGLPNVRAMLLSSAREVYFYASDTTGPFDIQLFRVQVPEPGGAAALIAAALFLCRRGRRSGTRPGCR